MLDVFQVYPNMQKDFNKADILADLNLFIKTDDLGPDSFYESINNMTSTDGKLLWLATSANPDVIAMAV
jgi:hypothetical protein